MNISVHFSGDEADLIRNFLLWLQRFRLHDSLIKTLLDNRVSIS